MQGFSPTRIWAVLAKEFTQISRDRLEADWGPRLVKVARDIRTGMAAQPSVVPAAAAVRPVTNGHSNGSNGGNGHRPPLAAMARR